MDTDHDTIPAGSEDPEVIAREAAEALGFEVPPDLVRAILATGRRHVEFVERHGGPEKFE